MRKYLTLYLKEFKKLKFIFLIFFMIHVFIDLLFIFLDIKPYGKTCSSFGNIIFFTVFAHPFILAYVYRIEWNTNSNYQLLSFPIRRFSFILSKYLAVLTMCIFFSLGTVVWTYFFSINERAYDLRIPEPTLYDFVGMPLIYFILIFVLLSEVSLIESVHYAVKRNWILFGFFVFILCTFSYLWIGVELTDYLHLIGIKGTLYSIASGVLFLLIGLSIFEKYAEV